jgi:O-antigen/teichoic acid export membrane protein
MLAAVVANGAFPRPPSPVAAFIALATVPSPTRNARIASNTLTLYVRMVLSMAVSLYTVRVVLNSLGEEDYGIYSVIGGVVALLAFLPGSMAAATQRFFAHAIGSNDEARLAKSFGVNALLYIGMAAVALLFLLTCGSAFVGNFLAVPTGRHEAAETLFRLSAFTFASTILPVPFIALIIAREDITTYAYITLVESLLRLLTAAALSALPGDKMLIYAWLVLATALLTCLIYAAVCRARYPECRLKSLQWDSSLGREIVGFTGWSMIGQLATVARGQAVTVMINQIFDPTIVAARAIALSVANQSNMLAIQFNTSLYPPIVKSFAADKLDEMHSLVINGAKATFFLMWIPTLPILIDMSGILTLWLAHPPKHATPFARLAVIEMLIVAISLPLATAARASGRVAAYESILGAIQLLSLPISWIFLASGFAAMSVFYVALAITVLMFAVRLKLACGLTGLPAARFARQTLAPVLVTVLISTALAATAARLTPLANCSMLLRAAAIGLLTTACVYACGISTHQRRQLAGYVNHSIRRTLKRTTPSPEKV